MIFFSFTVINWIYLFEKRISSKYQKKLQVLKNPCVDQKVYSIPLTQNSVNKSQSIYKQYSFWKYVWEHVSISFDDMKNNPPCGLKANSLYIPKLFNLKTSDIENEKSIVSHHHKNNSFHKKIINWISKTFRTYLNFWFSLK